MPTIENIMKGHDPTRRLAGQDIAGIRKYLPGSKNESFDNVIKETNALLLDELTKRNSPDYTPVDYSKVFGDDYGDDARNNLLSALLSKKDTTEQDYAQLNDALDMYQMSNIEAPIQTDLTPVFNLLAPRLLNSYQKPKDFSDRQNKILSAIESKTKIKDKSKESQAKRYATISDIIKEGAKTKLDRQKAILAAQKGDVKGLSDLINATGGINFYGGRFGEVMRPASQPRPRAPKGIKTYTDLDRKSKRPLRIGVMGFPKFNEEMGKYLSPEQQDHWIDKIVGPVYDAQKAAAATGRTFNYDAALEKRYKEVLDEFKNGGLAEDKPTLLEKVGRGAGDWWDNLKKGW